MLTTKLTTVKWVLVGISSMCHHLVYTTDTLMPSLEFTLALIYRAETTSGERHRQQWIWILGRTSRHKFVVSVTETCHHNKRSVNNSVKCQSGERKMYNLTTGKGKCTTLQSSHRTGYLLFPCEWNEINLEQRGQWTKNLKTDKWILPGQRQSLILYNKTQ